VSDRNETTKGENPVSHVHCAHERMIRVFIGNQFLVELALYRDVLLSGTIPPQVRGDHHRLLFERGKSMRRMLNSSKLLALGSFFGGSAVAAGAFGAHFLKDSLDTSMLAVFDTAARYHMYHALGLCIVAWAVDRCPEKRLESAGWLFMVGILLFSGSLYGMSLTGTRWLGAVTPIGGIAFLAGRLLLGYRAWTMK